MNNKGFSLIELLVSVAIMSIVMVIATTMMTNSSRYFERQSAMVEVQNESQLITNHLSEAVMEATGIQFTYDEATGTGTYILFDDDAKGSRRVLHYDNTSCSLYIISYDESKKVTDILGDTSWETEAYLISDEIAAFHMDYDWGYSTAPEEVKPDAEPALPPGETPVKVVRNPLKIRITYTIAHNRVSGDFEITSDCRNTLEKITINGTDYEALSR